MTFTQIVKDIFVRQPKTAKDNSGKGGVKAFMSKLSGAFMLPISVMAIAGLFLGVGAAIESHTSADTFGKFIKALGDPVFGAMPALFMVAVVIAFTEEAGVAVFAGLVSFLVFNAIQSPFIEAKEISKNVGTAKILGIDLNHDIQLKMYKIVGSFWGISSLNTSIFGGIIVGFIMAWAYNKFHQVELPAAIAFFGGKRFVALVGIILMIPLAFAFLLIWPWIGLGLGYFGEYSGKVAGLDSFIFGFIERSLIPFGLHHVFYAPLWWTSAGGDVVQSLTDWKGTITEINSGSISVASANKDLINEVVNQLKGLKSSVGQKSNLLTEAQILSMLNANSISGFAFDAKGSLVFPTLTDLELETAVTNLRDGIINLGKGTTITDPKDVVSIIKLATFEPIKTLNGVLIDRIKANENYLGDSFGWLAVNGSSVNTVTFTAKGSSNPETLKIFDFISKQLDLRLGRFMQGKFAFMQLGLPAAGAAMVMAAPKENRKDAFAIVFPAALTSFITGVTEPIEFTFLFLAPALFWGFHATMAAFSFLLMNLFGAHVGMTFSGGFIDSIIYGMLPFGQGTNFYWMYIIGLVYAPIYYFVFLWWIKKFDLATPGRGGNAKLFTKADYKASKGATKGGLNPQSKAIVEAFGGYGNITKFANCATRLRYDVKDQSKVDEKALKIAGAAGVVMVGKNHVQAIMGPKAEQLNSNIKANKTKTVVKKTTAKKTA